MADAGSCTLKWVFIGLTILVIIAFIIAMLTTKCFNYRYADVCTDYTSFGS